MSEYSAVPPPPGAGAAALGAAGIKKDAFADAVQRARQVRVCARAAWKIPSKPRSMEELVS